MVDLGVMGLSMRQWGPMVRASGIVPMARVRVSRVVVSRDRGWRGLLGVQSFAMMGLGGARLELVRFALCWPNACNAMG